MAIAELFSRGRPRPAPGDGTALRSGSAEAAAEQDDRLVRRCVAGDRFAFDELVARHRNRVYALARTVLGNAEDANDLTQETFVRAYEALPRYECRRQFWTWLATICANLCKNRLKARRPTLSLEEADALERLPDPDPSPEARSIAGERMRILRDEIARMPARDRLIVTLFHQEETSIEESARITGCRVGATKVAIHRARARLRVRLERVGMLSD